MAKAMVTIVVEYDMEPEDYQGEVDPKIMLQIDVDNYGNGDLDLAELLDSVVDVTWKVVE